MQLEPNWPAWKMENVNVVHKHKNLYHAPRPALFRLITASAHVSCSSLFAKIMHIIVNQRERHRGWEVEE